MRQRKVSLGKQKHELSKYLYALRVDLYKFASDVGATVGAMTAHIRDDGIGEIFLPSRSAFEHLNPLSTPIGLQLPDGSFFVFRETVRYGYRDESATEPAIYRTRYGYHYQRPQDRFYFRYDHHPNIGDPDTHPLYHLHSAGWREGATQFQDVPRYPVKEVTLTEVLHLIRVSFF